MTVLNPDLYRRLVNEFGTVEIGAHGEKAVGQRVNRRTRTGETVRGWKYLHYGECYMIDCPFCTDVRKRCWVNHNYGSKDPLSDRKQRRGFWGCYNESCEDDDYNDELLYDRLFGHRNRAQRIQRTVAVKVVAQAEIQESPVDFPGECSSLLDLKPDHEAVQYLIERNFDPRTTSNRFDLWYCDTASETYAYAEGRLIIPITSDGQLAGWQARALNGELPKYLSMRGMRKSRLLYNFDCASGGDVLAICEGPTSAWRCWPYGVATMGKSLSPHQAALIAEWFAAKPGRAAVLFYDADVDAKDLARSLTRLKSATRSRCRAIRLKTGDPADRTERQCLELIQRAVARYGITIGELAHA